MRNFERRLSRLEGGCLCRLCRETDCINRRIENMTEDEIDAELVRLLQIIKDDAPTSPSSEENQHRGP